jgi:hypothetical protein
LLGGTLTRPFRFSSQQEHLHEHNEGDRDDREAKKGGQTSGTAEESEREDEAEQGGEDQETPVNKRMLPIHMPSSGLAALPQRRFKLLDERHD